MLSAHREQRRRGRRQPQLQPDRVAQQGQREARLGRRRAVGVREGAHGKQRERQREQQHEWRRGGARLAAAGRGAALVGAVGRVGRAAAAAAAAGSEVCMSEHGEQRRGALVACA